MDGHGLDGASVIVTGAGSGIGKAAALRFAGVGAGVVVADVNGTAAGAVVALIEQAGGAAVAVAGDLGDAAVAEEVVSTAVTTYGGLDVLVNNAGLGTACGL